MNWYLSKEVMYMTNINVKIKKIKALATSMKIGVQFSGQKASNSWTYHLNSIGMWTMQYTNTNAHTYQIIIKNNSKNDTHCKLLMGFKLPQPLWNAVVKPIH